MGCNCGGSRNTVTKFRVTGPDGKKIGEYPTRAEAEKQKVAAGAGAKITPVATP